MPADGCIRAVEDDERLTMAGANAEWNDIVRDLDRVEQVTIEQGPKRFCAATTGPWLRQRGVQGGRCGVATVGPADPDRHTAAS